MHKLFPWVIVIEFTIAAILCLYAGQPYKATFYMLSALINVNVLFLN